MKVTRTTRFSMEQIHAMFLQASMNLEEVLAVAKDYIENNPGFISDEVVPFGKYKGQTTLEVWSNDPAYVRYMVTRVDDDGDNWMLKWYSNVYWKFMGYLK